MRTDNHPMPRRQFIKSVFGAGGALALAASGHVSLARSDTQTLHTSQSQGYRLTRHVQAYYQTLRV